MPTVTYKLIHTANAYLARVAIEVYNSTLDQYVAFVAGDPTVTVSYCRSADGTNVISGLNTLQMAEAVGAPGTYTLIVSTSLLAALAPYADQVIFQVVKAGVSQNLQVVTPLRVTVPRYAQ